MTRRVHDYLDRHAPATPCLVIDIEEIENAYHRLKAALPDADIYYAVKANPAREIVSCLAGLGSGFDAASIGEIETCLAAGADPKKISYGNTIKKAGDIARSHAAGIDLFAFDSREELEKLAAHAPGARVFCRILLANQAAGWPMSDKFGCSLDMAADLIRQTKAMGLTAWGVSFHVGSQQVDLEQWDIALGKTAMLFTDLYESGIELKMVNVGGGMPVPYRGDAPTVEKFADRIRRSVTDHFGNHRPEISLEPGRLLVAAAGVIESEVILVSRKSADSNVRWVYLDIGTNGGLIEAINHHIRYPVQALGGNRPSGPVAVAGPTCDWADIISRDGLELPLDLQAGDRVRLLNAGAYTATCATVGFNGFPPLSLRCI